MDYILPIIYYSEYNFKIRIFQNSHPVQKLVNSVMLFFRKFLTLETVKTNFIKGFFVKFSTQYCTDKILSYIFYCEYRNHFLSNNSTVKTNFNSGLFRSNCTNMNRLYSTLYLLLQISKSSLCRDIFKRRQLLFQSMYNFIIISLKIFENDDL